VLRCGGHGGAIRFRLAREPASRLRSSTSAARALRWASIAESPNHVPVAANVQPAPALPARVREGVAELLFR
jgi:hypothetical protein